MVCAYTQYGNVCVCVYSTIVYSIIYRGSLQTKLLNVCDLLLFVVSYTFEFVKLEESHTSLATNFRIYLIGRLHNLGG